MAAVARQRDATQDEVWAGSAPTAWAAAMMMAIVLPNPTRAATTADVTIDRRMIRLPLAELCRLDRTEGLRQFAGGTFLGTREPLNLPP